MKVEIVAFHVYFWETFFRDSSAVCMPNASENESANATVRIPPITAASECVEAFKPTINPNVVIIPDVRPKLSPIDEKRSILVF